MSTKKLKKMPRLKGDVPVIYKAEVIYKMAAVINALAEAVDFLNEEIEILKTRFCEKEDSGNE